VVARAGHELRGPLTAARLALHGAGRASAGAGWAEAVGLELDRACAALSDLAGATAWPRRGRRVAAGSVGVVSPCARPAAEAAHTLVDLTALVRAQSGPWTVAAPAVGRRITVAAPEEEVLVRGDRGRLAQAVGNLLANAVEHGDGTIRLTVGRASAMARLEVTDEGRGLRAPLDRLVGAPRGGRGARGRGLAIAAGVAAQHGGRLVTAPSSGGARLALELPAAAPAAAAATEAR
jgi:signal transduction histidine kinase